jgi:hypothetical protein
VKLFDDSRLYRKREVAQALRLSDRALDAVLARAGIQRVRLSARSHRWLGADLNAVLARASGAA